MSEKFEIWIEGSCSSDGSYGATRLLRKGEFDSHWEGISFQQATVKALNELHWQMLYEGGQGCGTCYYDREINTYYGCRFFDNEQDARKSFG